MRRMGTALALVLSFALTGAVRADPGEIHIEWDRRDRDRGYYGRSFESTYRLGYDRGYHEGLHHGEKDGERNRRFDFRDDRRYRNGDSGYRRDYGPRHIYVDGFRDGYERGYRRAYRAHGRYGYDRDGYGYDDRYDRDRHDRDRHRW